MNDPDVVAWPVCPKCRSSVMLCRCARVSEPREPVMSDRPTDSRLIMLRRENRKLRELFQRWITEWEATWVDPDEVDHEWTEIYHTAKKLVSESKE